MLHCTGKGSVGHTILTWVIVLSKLQFLGRQIRYQTKALEFGCSACPASVCRKMFMNNHKAAWRFLNGFEVWHPASSAVQYYGCKMMQRPHKVCAFYEMNRPSPSTIFKFILKAWPFAENDIPGFQCSCSAYAQRDMGGVRGRRHVASWICSDWVIEFRVFSRSKGQQD